jgi:CRP-like cAMP-binding protein
VGLAGPGILIGVARAIVENDDEIYDYSALDDSVVVLMPTPLLLQILEQFPLLWRDMALKLLKQNRAEMSTLMKRMIGTLSCRLAATIERLATLYGVREQGNLQVRLRLTQEDLASILQVTRQSVNKDLRMLELRGVVALDYNIITVLNPEALKKAASESR